MGQHRSDQRTRGVSKGPIIAVVSVIVLVLGVVGWFQLRDRTSSQGTAAAGTCVEGDATLTVAADPDIAGPLRELATRFTESLPVIRDHCVSVSVHEADSQAVSDVLAAAPDGPWNADLGPAPALWIPATGTAVERLAGTGAVDGQPKSIASSPVVVAAPEELALALTAAGTGWQTLPTLQSGKDSLAGLGLAGWGSLKLALPTGPGSGATGAAIEAVAAATVNAGTGPLTEAQAASPQVTAAIGALENGSRSIDGTPAATADTLDKLSARSDHTAASFHAVPATEQQVFAHGDGLIAFAPAGATPVADHPAAILTTPWVDETLGRAAAQFVEFLRQPEQAQSLVDAGFRVGDRTPAATERTPMPALEQVLAPAAAPAAARLASTFANPAVPQATTILLDVSGSMGYADGDGTRLSNTVDALSARIVALGETSNVGLWVYSRGLDGSKPYLVKVPTGPMSDGDRRQRLETALQSLRPATATSTYASMIAAHDSAVNAFVDGRPNSVLLITDGPNDDTSTTKQQLTKALSGTAHPVRVDVISIGENSDQGTLQAMAQQTNGTFAAVPSTQGPALADALEKTLS
ncbi:von Willebrand factor type A domain-containing protein [Rhodococcus sp. OK519]|uniref:substrate-binding domain-containing protein n=1 Tax=Rhodococcus sp. OK519 TaxID=2135729 RepID=UPI000D3A9B17|nr:von Willebrand factor type A domain-containing protein [Rhodococcus sp. OK519]